MTESVNSSHPTNDTSDNIKISSWIVDGVENCKECDRQEQERIESIYWEGEQA